MFIGQLASVSCFNYLHLGRRLLHGGSLIQKNATKRRAIGRTVEANNFLGETKQATAIDRLLASGPKMWLRFSESSPSKLFVIC
jgi:hypothetical protein